MSEPPPIPYNAEIEMALLGSFLLDSKQFDGLLGRLQPTDFYMDAHRCIYEAICAIRERGEPISLLTVNEVLLRLPATTPGSTSLFDQCGGMVYLMNLMEATPSATFATHYAEKVIDLSVRRSLMVEMWGNFTLLKTDDQSLKKLVAQNGATSLVERINERLQTTTKKIEWGFQQVGAFLASLGEPPPYVVQGLIPDKRFFYIAAEPKWGKSFFVLGLCESIASGRPFLGEFEICVPGPAFWFCMEDPMWTTANRLIARGVKADYDFPFHISYERFDFSNPVVTRQLKEYFLELPIRPSIVIIDTAIEGLNIEDWNDAGETSRKLQPLREFALEVCPVGLNIHNNKAEGGNASRKIRGSSAIAGKADFIISFKSREFLANGDMLIEAEVEGRDVRIPKLLMQLDTTTEVFRSVNQEDVTGTKKDSTRQEQYTQIENVFSDTLTQATVATLSEALGWVKKVCWQVCTDMVKAGRLVDTGEKERIGRGTPATLYSLPTCKEDESPLETELSSVDAFFNDSTNETDDLGVDDPFVEE